MQVLNGVIFIILGWGRFILTRKKKTDLTILEFSLQKKIPSTKLKGKQIRTGSILSDKGLTVIMYMLSPPTENRQIMW